VASRIDETWLPAMAKDTDAAVRREAARRMKAWQLTLLLDDPDWRVRYEVASRAERSHLGRLADDGDELVRGVARLRLGKGAGDLLRLVAQKPALQAF
jgi:hypothetical protein